MEAKEGGTTEENTASPATTAAAAPLPPPAVINTNQSSSAAPTAVATAPAPTPPQPTSQAPTAANAPTPVAPQQPPGVVGSDQGLKRKKRGRPRKYGPDGSLIRPLNATPISSSVPTGGSSEYTPAAHVGAAMKRGRARPLDFSSRQLYGSGGGGFRLEGLGMCYSKSRMLLIVQIWN